MHEEVKVSSKSIGDEGDRTPQIKPYTSDGNPN